MGNILQWEIAASIGQIKRGDEILLSTDGGISGTKYEVVGVLGTELEIRPNEIITEDATVTLPVDRPASKIDFSTPAIKDMVYIKASQPDQAISSDNRNKDAQSISEEERQKAIKKDERVD